MNRGLKYYISNDEFWTSENQPGRSNGDWVEDLYWFWCIEEGIVLKDSHSFDFYELYVWKTW